MVLWKSRTHDENLMHMFNDVWVCAAVSRLVILTCLVAIANDCEHYAAFTMLDSLNSVEIVTMSKIGRP